MEYYHQQIEVDADMLGMQYLVDDEPVPDGLNQMLWGFGCHKAIFDVTWEYELQPAYSTPETCYNEEFLMTDAKFRAWKLNVAQDVPNELREELAVWASKLLPEVPVTIGWEELK